jgi:hypothetical protein
VNSPGERQSHKIVTSLSKFNHNFVTPKPESNLNKSPFKIFKKKKGSVLLRQRSLNDGLAFRKFPLQATVQEKNCRSGKKLTIFDGRSQKQSDNNLPYSYDLISNGPSNDDSLVKNRASYRGKVGKDFHMSSNKNVLINSELKGSRYAIDSPKKEKKMIGEILDGDQEFNKPKVTTLKGQLHNHAGGEGSQSKQAVTKTTKMPVTSPSDMQNQFSFQENMPD